MSYTITAEVETAGGTAVNGVVLAQAGRFGGWSLYVKDGKPTYTYNWLGLKEYTVASTQALPAGKVTIRFEFAYDGGGRGKGGMGKIFVNGQEVASGRIEKTQPISFRRTKEPMSVWMKEPRSLPATRSPSGSPARFTR